LSPSPSSIRRPAASCGSVVTSSALEVRPLRRRSPPRGRALEADGGGAERDLAAEIAAGIHVDQDQVGDLAVTGDLLTVFGLAFSQRGDGLEHAVLGACADSGARRSPSILPAYGTVDMNTTALPGSPRPARRARRR
jgi:hypothetical protein